MSLTDYTAGIRRLGDWKFHALQLEDQAFFSKQIRRTSFPVDLWSSNFAYLWAVSHSGHRQVLWRADDGMLVPFVLSRTGALYLQCLPFGEATPAKAVNVLYRCMQYCLAYNKGDKERTMLKMAGEKQLAFLRESPAFDRCFTPRAWQGIEQHLSLAKLAGMEGADFANVRNRVRKFYREHPEAGVRLYRPDDFEALLALDRRWRETSGSKYSNLIDGAYYRELVAHGEELGQTTLVMCEHGRIIGMVAGSLLPGGQSWGSLLKFEPGMPGLSETLLVEFAREMRRRDPHAETVNIGSDLGESGLRRYKLKFRPVFSQKRYRVTLK